MGKYGRENENLEFKREYTKKLLEEVDGFLNSEGGVILFGVDDNGDPYDVEDLTKLQLQITNALQDSILPNPSIYIDIKQKNDEVVKVKIEEGENKPYYLRSKGINSKGVFIRKGSGNYPATEEEIKALIRQSDGYKFEEARSPIQDLTFEAASSYFLEKKVEFKEKFQTLGLIQPETGLYTNLALLLSDQNPYSIKVATFGDEFKTEFLSRKEFFGSVLKQIDEVLEFISIVNKNSFKIERQYRVEKSDYPESSIREALINSIIHKDYDIGDNTFIKLNNIDMEITSFGCLPKGIQLEDLKRGISQLRNPKLANIFYRLELIEAYGTGIIRIFSDYINEEKKPEILLSPNTFQMKLPNRNYQNTKEIKKKNEIEFNLTKKQVEILSILNNKEEMSAPDLMKESGFKKGTVYNNLNKLNTLNLIDYHIGNNKRMYFLSQLGKDILQYSNFTIKG